MVFIDPKDQRVQREETQTPEIPPSSGPTSGVLESIQANLTNFVTNDLLIGDELKVRNAANRVTEEFNTKAKKGELQGEISDARLENPFDITSELETAIQEDIFTAERGNTFYEIWNAGLGISNAASVDRLQDSSEKKLFFEKIKKAREQFPNNKYFQFDTPKKFKEGIENLSQPIEQRAQEVNREPQTVSGEIAGFVGPMAGIVADPLNAATLGVGAIKASSIGRAVLYDTIAETTIEAVQQPFIQKTREETGLEGGLKRGVKNVVAVSAVTPGFSGGLRGAGKLLGKLTPDLNKQVFESIKKLPDDVQNDLIEGNVDNQTIINGLRFLDENGELNLNQKVAKQVLEHKQSLIRTNPFSNKEKGKIINGLQDHYESIDEFHAAFEEGRPPKISREELPDAVARSQNEIKEPTNKIKVDDIENSRNPDVDFEGQNGRPIFYENDEGNIRLVDGSKAVKGTDAGEVDGILLRSKDNVSSKEAEAVALGKRLEEGRATLDDIADKLGIDRALLDNAIGSATNFSKMLEPIKNLSPRAMAKFVTEPIPANLVSRVAKELDDVSKQVPAMDAVRIADNEQQAETILKEGMERGFGDIKPKEILRDRQEALEKATAKLLKGEESITVNGEDIDVGDNFIEGIRELSQQRGPIGVSLRKSVRNARDGDGVSASEQFIKRIEDEFNSGRASRDDVIEVANAKKARRKVQSIAEGRSEEELEEISEEIRKIKEGESDLPGEIQEELENQAEQLGIDLDSREIDVPTGRTNDEGVEIFETMTVKERLDSIDDVKKQLESIRETCLN